MTVLVVDDYDPFIFAVTALLLEREAAGEEIQVLQAHDCTEAMEHVDRSSIDCILMDQKLAGGVSGVGCTQEIRHRGYSGAIVMVTGYAREMVLARQAAEAGTDAFLYKDDALPALVSTIRSAIAARDKVVSAETAARKKQQEIEALLAEMDQLAAKVKAHLARK